LRSGIPGLSKEVRVWDINCVKSSTKPMRVRITFIFKRINLKKIADASRIILDKHIENPPTSKFK
jgi:hypothetical protein